MRLRRAGGLDDFLLGRAGTAERDVLANGRREQRRLLQDDPDLIAQRIERDGANIVAVDRDTACRHVVKAWNQIDDGGLAGAGRAEQRDHLTRLGLAGNVVEHAVTAKIGERNVLETDRSAHGRQRKRAGRVAHFRLRVENLKNARARRRGDRELRHDLAQPARR